MKPRLLYILTLSAALLFAGGLTSSCTPQFRKTKKLYRSLDKHADCPTFNKKQRAAKHKPMKGGKKRGGKRK